MKTERITRLGIGIIIHRTNEELVGEVLKQKHLAAVAMRRALVEVRR